ncbi:MAG: DUF1343 domain-containing protein [Pseudomonadota bacterium]
MKLGLDRLTAEYLHLLENKRLGILANTASVNSDGENIVDLLLAQEGLKITTLFGPEHGLSSVAQDMESVADSKFSNEQTGKPLPVYSLYGNSFSSLSPRKKMLDQIDCLIIDLQDIGSRYYTYIWTMALCLKACQNYGKQVIICDRPNPLNGLSLEGALPKPGFESFVGLRPLPVRHGMTIAEIANYLVKEYNIECGLQIIHLQDWPRSWVWPDTELAWHNPSPNMRSYEAALLYPGMCLIEGTNISEGRGTNSPFEVVGAPFIHAEKLIAEFEKLNLPGIKAKPIQFVPGKQKWAGKSCQGVRWKILDEKTFLPYLTGLAFIWCLHKLYHQHGFEWRTEKYEFVSDKPAIDLLTGSSFFRENINESFDVLAKLSKAEETFMDKRKKFLLY